MMRGISRFQQKLGRAEEQIVSLEAQIEAWVKSRPIQTEWQPYHGDLARPELVITGLGEFKDKEWALLAGECIHNMRSALDNFAYALACQFLDPPSRPKHISFPIKDKPGDFQKEWKRLSPQFFPNAEHIFNSVQPFSTSADPVNSALWWLRELSNSDKHRVPHLVAVAPTAMEIETESKDIDLSRGAPFLFWTGPLDIGTVIVRPKEGHAMPKKIQGGRLGINAGVVIEDGLSERWHPSITTLLRGSLQLIRSLERRFYERR